MTKLVLSGSLLLAPGNTTVPAAYEIFRHPRLEIEILDDVEMEISAPAKEQSKQEAAIVSGLHVFQALIVRDWYISITTRGLSVYYSNLDKLYLGYNKVLMERDSNNTYFQPHKSLWLVDLCLNDIRVLDRLKFAALQNVDALDVSRRVIEEADFTLPTNESLRLLIRKDDNNVTTISRDFLGQLNIKADISFYANDPITFCSG